MKDVLQKQKGKKENSTVTRFLQHTATAGALPIPAVQCTYVTPPFRLTALYSVLTTAGSRILKSNASKSLFHQDYNMSSHTLWLNAFMTKLLACTHEQSHHIISYVKRDDGGSKSLLLKTISEIGMMN